MSLRQSLQQELEEKEKIHEELSKEKQVVEELRSKLTEVCLRHWGDYFADVSLRTNCLFSRSMKLKRCNW